MIKSIKVKLDVIESMLFFWKATNDREKVGEAYLTSIADQEDMSVLYHEEFTKDSVRKVLSAISNREMLSTGTKAERKFWNNNMWMMEDLDYTDMMIQPVKQLNLDAHLPALQAMGGQHETVEVVFVPGIHDVCYFKDNKVVINFFYVKPDLYEDDVVTVEGKDFTEYVVEKITELLNQ